MGLTYCWNCSRPIHTDASPTCPFCGVASYEVKQHHCVINGFDYDLTLVAEYYDAWKRNFLVYEQHSKNLFKSWIGLDEANSQRLWNQIVAKGSIPISYKPLAIEEIRAEEAAEKVKREAGVPKCPTCGSTNLTKIGAGSRAIDGFFFGRHSVEGRAQWRCENCGHLF